MRRPGRTRRWVQRARRTRSPALRRRAPRRYWAHSGLVARAAATLLARTERGVRLASLYDGAVVPTVRLLCFQERCVAAALASSKLSLGSYHTAAVLRSAAGGPPRLHTFGRGFHGQLGRGGYDNATAPTPVAVPVDASLLASVACGSSHSAVLNSDGAVWTWGLASRCACAPGRFCKTCA